jgi:hypothetical protein
VLDHSFTVLTGIKLANELPKPGMSRDWPAGCPGGLPDAPPARPGDSSSTPSDCTARRVAAPASLAPEANRDQLHNLVKFEAVPTLVEPLDLDPWPPTAKA